MEYSKEFEHFCQRLAAEPFTETDKAMALIWFADRISPREKVSVREIADQMHEVGLTKQVNTSRLVMNLSSRSEVVRVVGTYDDFRIALARKPALNGQFEPFLKHRRAAVSGAILPDGAVTGTRPYLETIAHQINGCYDCGFYDGCAVLCRRLIESLLIEAFAHAGQLSAIQQNGSLFYLDDIIAKAKSGSPIHLARSTGKVLDKIKEIGDTAAHDRYYTTTEQDIAEFRSGLRKVVSELLTLSGIR